MNVLVCDDERQIVDSIIETLEKKTEETQVSSRFYGFSQPSQIDLSLPYDIALLDIDMGETNGIELARKLRAENENIVIENNARLIIIDPIQAYLGADVDMNRANEVRPIFMRLGQVAQRTGCAILLIGHLNKAAGMQSLQRGLGSIDIAAAVRSVMFIGKLKHDPTMRILTHEKSSLAPPGASLAFSLGDEGGFRWVGEYDITADEMLSGIEPQRETKTQQAKDLICALLAGGKQVLSEDIDKAALERGIPGRTVRDAKRELGDALKSKIVEGRKKVFWME